MSRIRGLSSVFVMVLTVALSGCILKVPKSEAPGIGSLQIVVVDVITNEFLSDVTVKAGESIGTTDEDGTAEFSEVPEGKAAISLSKSGYQAQSIQATVVREKVAKVHVAMVPSAYHGLTFTAHWDAQYAADFHKDNAFQPLVTGGQLGTTGGFGTLTMLGEPITYSNSGNGVVNPHSGTIVLWLVPQTAMSSAPTDVYTLIDVLTTTPEGRTDSGFHVWWGWGGFQFKAHADQKEVASVWYASLWKADEHHSLVVSWDKESDSMAIYADGEKIRSTTFPGVPAVADRISFGARHAGTQPYNNLVLDKVMIFDRSLDQGEIDALLGY